MSGHVTSLRVKLGALVAVGLVATLVVAAPGLRDRWALWNHAGDARPVVAAARALDKYDRALGYEAEVSAWYLASGDARAGSDLAPARVATDRAMAELVAAATAAGPEARHAIAPVRRAWSDLREQRAGIDRRTAPDATILTTLTEIRAATAPGFERLARGLTPRVSRPIVAAGRITTARAAVGDEQRALTVGLARNELTPAVLERLRQAPGTVVPALAAVTGTGPDPGVSIADAARLRAATATSGRITEIARLGFVPFLNVERWLTISRAQLAALDRYGTAATRAAERHAAAVEDAAGRAFGRLALLVGLCALVVLLLGLALVRAVRAPIRSLARATQDAANRRASPRPEANTVPIAVDARALVLDDEVGDLARATRALDDAAGRSIASPGSLPRDSGMYVQLAERNQPLLTRQLELLDELEALEDDPSRLASLFRLDHLATRMRRNGESLLVLAGAEAVRAEREPVPLLDIVRGAVSEIAHFTRIDIVGLPSDLAVIGSVSVDLAHVLAELLENASTCSPPDTRVFVGARRRPGGLELTISDEGRGIPVPRLDELNEMLAHPPMPGLDLSDAVGLVVVARLGERIGASVTLRSAPEVGTSAVVELPTRILVELAEFAPPMEPPVESPAHLEPAPPEAHDEISEPEPEPEPSEHPPETAVALGSTPEPEERSDGGEPPQGSVPEPIPLAETERTSREDSSVLEPEPLAETERTSRQEGSVPEPIRLAETERTSREEGSSREEAGVHFTPVPVTRHGDLLPNHERRSHRRRGARRSSTGTLHPAPTRTRGRT